MAANNSSLRARYEFFPGIMPIDASSAGATGIRCKLDGGNRALIICVLDEASAGDDTTLTIQQHNAASGGTSKALNLNEVWYKEGATTTLDGSESYQRYTFSTADEAYVDTTHGERETIYVVEIAAEDMDLEDGFYWFSANVDDGSSNAKEAVVLYMVERRRVTNAAAES